MFYVSVLVCSPGVLGLVSGEVYVFCCKISPTRIVSSLRPFGALKR